MKKKIQIITGFLEWGKTSLINKLVEKEIIEKNKKVLLVVFEQGIEEFDIKKLKEQNIEIKLIEENDKLDDELFYNLEEQYSPDNIIIEYNGTWELSDILKVKMPFNYYIDNVIYVLDAEKFTYYMKNMSNIIAEQISNSDVVFVNRFDNLSNNKREVIKKVIKSINRKSKIIFCEENDENLDEYLYKAFNRRMANPIDKVLNYILLLMAGWIFSIYLSALNNTVSDSQINTLKNINTVFLSILLQAIPFILVGVFISSILQIFVSDRKLIKLFNVNRIFKFPIAALMGIFLPICDCGMVPITSRLVRKGVSLSQAITFMLSSAVVNPVVIISTIYAFPEDYKVAVFRIVFGVIISIIAGMLIELLFKQNDAIEIDTSDISQVCSSGYVGNLDVDGFGGKVIGLFRHTTIEFFSVGKYLIVGAMISSIIQVMVPKDTFMYVGTRSIIPIGLMIFASFFMSICSNSNAFIAKSFLNNFPINAVLAFMVMGPMLDLKNLLMLMQSFNKRFVLILVIILLVASFVLFSLPTIFFYGGVK